MKININTQRASSIEVDKLFKLLHNGGWDFKVDDNPNNDTDELYNIVLVHVSRTWERLRVAQEHEEMPVDNIGSTDVIGQIATQIFEGKVMQGFVTGSAEVRENDYWLKNTTEGMSDIFIEAEAEEMISVQYLGKKPKPPVRKWEVIDTGIEINEDFLPNADLTYTIEFDGVDKFRAKLEEDNIDRKMVGVENAPKTLHYTLNRPIEELTQADKETILDYRGLDNSEDVCASDVFMEKSHITFKGADAVITMKVSYSAMFEAGESAEDFLGRTADIYLHSQGDEGHHDKDDLGGDYEIKYT